jgi:hypothetical protein
LAQGYRLCQFWQLSCPAHGVYRVAAETETADFPCPVCLRDAATVFLCEGFTRRTLPFVEQVEKSCPLGIKSFWRELDELPRRARSKSRRMASTIS